MNESTSKYQRWHDQLIERARNRTIEIYKERHHIIPRSLGGSDATDNLVDLTYREHFLIHWLLTKILVGRARRLMAYALHCMTFECDDRYIVAAWQYEVAKRALKRETLLRAKERFLARRVRFRNRFHKVEATAERASSEVIWLNPASPQDRAKLTALTKHFIKADPNRSLQLQSGAQHVNIRAKKIIQEANRVERLRNR